MQNTDKILKILKQILTEKELSWVLEKCLKPDTLNLAFVSAPRFIKKQKVSINSLIINDIEIENWLADRLVRVYFLLILEGNLSVEIFKKTIDTLFETAEINEAVALYSAIQFFQKPDVFIQKATDAIRSNISDVFDSLAFNNNFPLHYFNELAWNQLVLKCIFNDKPIHLIIGLESRSNQILANTISDFAHERWAAGRSVPSQAWRLVVNFINEPIIHDLEFLFKSYNEKNKIAAVLVCQNSSHKLAKTLLEKYQYIAKEVSKVNLNWGYLEKNS